MTKEELKRLLLLGQTVFFCKIKVRIKSTRYDQYFAEISTPKYNFVISNFHPQSGLNLYSKDGSCDCFTGTLNQIAEKVAHFLFQQQNND